MYMLGRTHTVLKGTLHVGLLTLGLSIRILEVLRAQGHSPEAVNEIRQKNYKMPLPAGYSFELDINLLTIGPRGVGLCASQYMDFNDIST